jgi:sugar phosphate isomerase/epimerase
MKISFVISTQPTRFQAVTFSPDFEANAARLAGLRYDGIELAVRDPATLDVAAIKAVLDKYRLSVPAIGTGQAWGEEHLSFTNPDPEVRKRALDRIKSHIPLAREFNAIIIVGLIRGLVQADVTVEQAHPWLVNALKSIATTAEENGVRIAIEPINRYETNLLNNVADTLALIDEIGAGNIGVLYDTFHSNIEERDMQVSLRACGSRLAHVHLADSNRWAPGAGHVEFARVIDTLREMDYAGWVSAEILPKPDIASAQEQTIETMQPLLKPQPAEH